MTAVFCCVGALALTGSLHHIDKDLLGWWLCERQVKSGGLNGRPEKLPDVGISLKFNRNLSLIVIFFLPCLTVMVLNPSRFAIHGGFFLA